MNILVLTKRQYTGRDLLDDRFGRIRELPLELARLGHEVSGICLSYRPRPEGWATDGAGESGARVRWYSLNLGKLAIPGIFRYFRKARQIAEDLKPDLIWACSDSFQAIFGARLAKGAHIKCVVDLYDNFESFKATWLPGILPLFKKAVRNADGVTCVSRPLAERITRNYRRRGPVAVLENAVRHDLFHSRERIACRRKLGLPEHAKIIGTAGALYENRGIQALFRGFELLDSKMENFHLAVAGPRDRRSRMPTGPQIHDLGILPFEEVPVLLNALDVAVVCNRDSSFGRYSFPQKAHEILACRTPIVAAAVGAMKDLLGNHPECLFEPENPASLANAVRHQLLTPTILDLAIPGWSDIAKRLEVFLARIFGGVN